MDKLFESTWLLRITALVLAVLMFFYVKSLMGEGITSTSSNHVDILTDVPLEAYYDTDNLIVTGLPETVDVTIEGPIQLVINAKLKKDFKIFVDLSSLLIGEHEVKVQAENFSDKLKVKINPEKIKVSIEEKVTAELSVEPELNRSLLNEAYVLQNMGTEPSTVYVTGAKSVIASINYIKATVNASPGIKSSFEQDAEVKVLDSNLNKLNVLVEPAKVRVKVDIVEYGREIPIKITQVGTPAPGVTINRITTSTEFIKVFGPKSIIDGLTEIVVEFDVSEIQQTGSYNVKVEVPKGATKLSLDMVDVQAFVTKSALEETIETPQETTEETLPDTEQTEDMQNSDTENTEIEQ